MKLSLAICAAAACFTPVFAATTPNRVADFERTRIRSEANKQINSSPAMVFSRIAGGIWDKPEAIAVDAAGAIFVAGTTRLSLGDSGIPGDYDRVFVAKFDDSGSQLLWVTYLGGLHASSQVHALALDGAGNAYVAGSTDAADFPRGPAGYIAGGGGSSFAAKVANGNGQLLYVARPGPGAVWGIAVDSAGDAWLTGTTAEEFPITSNAPQKVKLNTVSAFVVKLDATGTTPLLSTYLSGPGGTWATGVAVDASGNAYISGFIHPPGVPGSTEMPLGSAAGSSNLSMGLLAKYMFDGSLSFVRHVSASLNLEFSSVAVDRSGPVLLAGRAFADESGSSTSAVVLKTDSQAQSPIYFRALGDASGVRNAVAVDAAGFANIVGGYVYKDSFPTTENAFSRILSPPLYPTGFLTRVDPSGGIVYSTFLRAERGAFPTGVAADLFGDVYVAGTATMGFPLTTPDPFPDLYSIGPFLTKVSFRCRLLGVAALYRCGLDRGFDNRCARRSLPSGCRRFRKLDRAVSCEWNGNTWNQREQRGCPHINRQHRRLHVCGPPSRESAL